MASTVTTLDQLRAELVERKKHKYNAQPTEHAGRRFASAAEAEHAAALELMQEAGEIRDLEYQPVYDLVVNGVKVGRYIGDFRYRTKRTIRATHTLDPEEPPHDLDLWDVTVVVDVKGVRTPVYLLKRRLVEALYRIRIVEVRP